MPVVNTPENVAQYISDNVAGLTIGTNVFYGQLGSTPTNQICVSPGAGPRPRRNVSLSSEIYFPVVHIYIRWNDYEDGYAHSISLRDLLEQAALSGPLASYMDCELHGSEPTSLEPTQDGQHLWMLTCMLTYEA
jgi:hypothetical protein